ncbi:MAG: hypothetical protein JOY62_11865 [Acidobacteriaceae bacterium]|nr:hypothetical protein [Acidobacteriaceae bacterium]
MTTTAGHGPTTTPGGHPVTGGNAGHGAAPSKVMGGHAVPATSKITHTANGSDVRIRPNGKVADVHDAKRGMDIHHGLNGTRRVEVDRADHTRIVAEGGGRAGYVQRPYTYQGREFAERTYVYNGAVYNRYYAPYYYRGVYINYYAPGYYYGPAFYGWVYNPWIAPVPYAWGWGGYPWYGYYGYYFTPYPVYASASFWLTDYIISTTLAAAYQAQVEANAAVQAQAAANAAALTEETKNLIAAEVQRQVALENAEAKTAQNGTLDPASSSVQRMLSDGVQHVFVAGRSLDIVDAQGGECAISEGDVMQLSGPPAANATAADLVMLTSKGGQECPRGASVSVSFSDLQEMQNHMRETIDQGLGELQTKQGKGGLPTTPVSASAAPVKASFVAAAPPPDPNAATEISQESQAADQAEKETLTQVAQTTAVGAGATAQQPTAPTQIAAPASPPTEISTGQTIDQVTGSLGPPKSIVDLGAKKIYIYKDMKITFKDGKVTDVQ